jgi:hypothetical protein
MCIRDVVQQAFNTGWLTVEAEDQLRSLLSTRYDRSDFKAFLSLQTAAMTGLVRQESRLPHPLDTAQILEMSTF